MLSNQGKGSFHQGSPGGLRKVPPICVVHGKVMIIDAEVITTDIEASNGVIHVVDKVLLTLVT